MTKEIIVSVIVDPFWAWAILMFAFGVLGSVLGIAIGWLTLPRYRVILGYSVRRCSSSAVAPGTLPRKPKRISFLQRLALFRRKFQPIIEVEGYQWGVHSRFFEAWHHAKYRGFCKREYGIKLPRGKVIVYKRFDEYAVRMDNTYYVIPWK